MSEKNNNNRQEFIDIYEQLLKEYADKDTAMNDGSSKTVKIDNTSEQAKYGVPDRNGNNNNYKDMDSRKKHRGIKAAVIITASVVLLAGVAGAAYLCGWFKSRGAEDTENSVSVSSASAEKAGKSGAAENEQIEISESSTNKTDAGSEGNIECDPTGEFKTDKKRFNSKTIKMLDSKVTAKYVVLYDVDADKIIYERSGHEKCYPASTTKMLTAIVGAKIIPADTVITVGEEIGLIDWDSSTAGLMVGMKMKFEALMDALMLPSGNDAAYTIAVNAARIYTGNDKLTDEEAVKEFMGLVNEAAKEIGCEKTHYVTPDGWHDDDHYTCAADLTKIAAYARTVPLVKASCSKAEAEWELIKEESSESSQESVSKAAEKPVSETSAESSETNEGEEEESEEVYMPDTMYWTNSNRLILPDSESYSKYCDGMKTGFTDEAGTSVVASATMEGHTFIAAIMFGETLYKKYDDANILFKEGFKLYGLNYTYSNEPEAEEQPEETSKQQGSLTTIEPVSQIS